MKTLLKISVILAAALLLPACASDDDGLEFWFGYANVRLTEEHKPGTQPQFELILDDETVMNIVQNNVYFPTDDALVDDTRVIVNFSILNERTLDGQKYYDIRLNAMQEILSKKPVYSSSVEDELGNDPIDVDQSWFGGRYLNVNFYLELQTNSDVKHFINLLVNEEHPNANADNVYVELRHNAYNEKPQERTFGRISFDISELIPEGRNSVTVHLQYTNYAGDTVTESRVYSRTNVQSGGDSAFSLRQELIGKIY